MASGGNRRAVIYRQSGAPKFFSKFVNALINREYRYRSGSVACESPDDYSEPPALEPLHQVIDVFTTCSVVEFARDLIARVDNVGRTVQHEYCSQ